MSGSAVKPPVKPGWDLNPGPRACWANALPLSSSTGLALLLNLKREPSLACAGLDHFCRAAQSNTAFTLGIKVLLSQKKEMLGLTSASLWLFFSILTILANVMNDRLKPKAFQV